MEWTEETVACLRGLWSEGLPTAEIGRRLGITKNAVIGKAHRLVLPPRPSPIPAVASTTRVHAETKAVPGPGHVAGTVGSGNLRSDNLGSGKVTAVAQAAWSPPPRSAPPHRAEPPPLRRAHSCCWPLGEPGKPGFHFCDDAALPTKPYCARHADLAYVKVREKREEAA